MTTQEPQYYEALEQREKYGETKLGIIADLNWREDPKRLSFVLARYKFVSKMLSNFGRVAEIGCGDGFASRIVSSEVNYYLGTDFDPIFIAAAKKDLPKYEYGMDFVVHDILSGTIPDSPFDGIFACDVLEHIDPSMEHTLFSNINCSLSPSGVVMIGTPSLSSQKYASPRSKAGHINCKSGEELRKLCRNYFSNVFLFGMNDEVIHTGYLEMSHYYFVICLNPIVVSA